MALVLGGRFGSGLGQALVIGRELLHEGVVGLDDGTLGLEEGHGLLEREPAGFHEVGQDEGRRATYALVAVDQHAPVVLPLGGFRVRVRVRVSQGAGWRESVKTMGLP